MYELEKGNVIRKIPGSELFLVRGLKSKGKGKKGEAWGGQTIFASWTTGTSSLGHQIPEKRSQGEAGAGRQSSCPG